MSTTKAKVLKGSEVTVQEGFTRQFPVEILTMIITKTDRNTLPACLRVSDQWFHLAGKILYSDIVIGWSGAAKLMRGAGISRPMSARSSDIANQKPKDAKTGFKRQLLKYVQTITIEHHTCPTDEAARNNLTRGTSLMTGLKQAILCPEASFSKTMPLCGKTPGCPILAGLECHSVTIQNIRKQGTSGGPLEMFTPILDHVKHATLVIQPLASYIGKGGPVVTTRKNVRPQDLAAPTRHLESVRIIVAMSNSEIESMEGALERAPNLAKLGPLQEFLASFLNLHPSRIEIYMFNTPSHLGRSGDTLDKFKEQLATKVDQHYQDSIKEFTKSKNLEAEHTNWSPNYQVFDVQHYFAQPNLCQELDRWLRSEWERDLAWMRNHEIREKKKAEQEATAGNAKLATASTEGTEQAQA